jgi:hypothetical protein
MSAPERIWAYETPDGDTGWLSDPTHGQATGSTEFVRADIAASQLAEARAEAERWAAQALKEEECRIAWQAERDRLAARLSENNRWPDPLQSPQAEAIRNGKIDMTEIVSLFDKMERELEQLRFVAADNARLSKALEPFALISSEGVVKVEEGHVTVTTCAEYFHRARATLQKEPQP